MLATVVALALLGAPESPVMFQKAMPVWPEGRNLEMNVQTGFVAAFPKPASGPASLRVTGSTLYRIYLNGEFLGYGPARGPHGHYRVDEWPLDAGLCEGENVLAIEVAGYNSNSYYVLDQPSFIQAEVLAAGNVIAATGGDDFEAVVLDQRVQKVQRYSFQRPFSEVYRMSPGDDTWMNSLPADAVSCALQPEVALLARRVPYPTSDVVRPTRIIARGTLGRRGKVEQLWKDRSLTGISAKLKGYPESELVTIPSIDLQYVTTSLQEESKPYRSDTSIGLAVDECAILDLGVNLTGFPGATVTCSEPTRLFFTFDEILSDNDVDFKRLGCVNVVTYELQPGTYRLESFEAYTMRYLKLMVLEGACKIRDVHLREYANPNTPATFQADDSRLNILFEAARQTYRQNAVDIFMDCPHRERAGWLCDSFFTARTAYGLGGTTDVEHNFIENFLLPDSFAHLPKGMLPMCYPADHYDGVFIPNWSLWFVVQLEEYLARSQDTATVAALEPKVRDLFTYFSGFENDDGLLEKLRSWVFVEWSKANEFVQDVNYPSNMLYAAALASAGRLYHDQELLKKADAIRETVRKQSYEGTFFVDNAIRKDDGSLEVTHNTSEVCQYFAFFFGTATPDTYPELWATLRDEFGPKRKETKAHPDVFPANAFVGNVLRLELLSRQGLIQQLLDETVDYNLYMADRTGTLWENDGAYASCDHGFASHVAHVLQRDVLGVYEVQPQAKHIVLRFAKLDLNKCSGTVMTPAGPVALSWERDGDTLRYTLDMPEGYTADVQTLNGLKAETN